MFVSHEEAGDKRQEQVLQLHHLLIQMALQMTREDRDQMSLGDVGEWVETKVVMVKEQSHWG